MDASGTQNVKTTLLLVLCVAVVLVFIGSVWWRADTPEQKVYRLLREFNELPSGPFDFDYTGRTREEIEADWQTLGGEARPALIKALKDPTCPKRYLAAGRLGKMADPESVEPLISCLEDNDFVVRMWVVNALSDIGDIRCVEAVLRRLSDPKSAVRHSAAHALGRFRDRRALKPLVKCLNDEDMMTRVAAVGSLGLLGDKAAVEPIRSLLQNESDEMVQEEARRTLSKLER